MIFGGRWLIVILPVMGLCIVVCHHNGYFGGISWRAAMPRWSNLIDK
jgi:hypothetical protein